MINKLSTIAYCKVDAVFNNIKQSVLKFKKDEQGAVAIEYVIIAAIMAGVVYAVFNTGLHDALDDAMGKITAVINKIS
ncbi:Flp family type IVb pilin [Vibrio sp. S4M6]|uniref:Flp family type IVb pilin n=1 Tax=Vibrio sinus TaxID=2946865 RepID=UPI00202A366E|nr:Flp family type IVb pilin [Vibrio sinus]MCL9783347.1 Flp family type IVb pilin [Vibrio sinus]